MKEVKLYNAALLLGIGVLLAGLGLHSWRLVAVGALVAGAGGCFATLMDMRR